MINLRIEFNGINVTPENKIYIEDCFQAIYSLSPSESSVSFTFEKNKDGFSGVAIIVSQIKSFKVSCQEDSLAAVMKTLNLEIRNSLVGWKKNRFDIISKA